MKWQRLAHLVHHQPVDTPHLVCGHGAIERDVEGRVVGSHPRPFLHHLLAKRLSERAVQQMCRRMMARDVPSPRCIHRGGRGFADSDFACDDGADVGDHSLGRLLRVLDAHPAAGGADETGVTDLSARLGVERRALEIELHLVALRHELGAMPIDPQPGDPGFGFQLGIAGEFGARKLFDGGPVLRDRSARAVALSRHRGLESVLVDGEPAILGQLARQLEGKSEGVVELERVLAGEDPLMSPRDLLELLDACFYRPLEPVALLLHDCRDR